MGFVCFFSVEFFRIVVFSFVSQFFVLILIFFLVVCWGDGRALGFGDQERRVEGSRENSRGFSCLVFQDSIFERGYRRVAVGFTVIVVVQFLEFQVVLVKGLAGSFRNSGDRQTDGKERDKFSQIQYIDRQVDSGIIFGQRFLFFFSSFYVISYVYLEQSVKKIFLE